MTRCLLLLTLSGCTWISDATWAERIDLDADGVDGLLDCNDDDAGLTALVRFFVDEDGDGFGDPGKPVDACRTTAPPGAVDNDGDCDDADASVHPDAAEVCNGSDDDCDAQVDDTDDDLDRNTAGTWLPDQDGDGFPAGDTLDQVVRACLQPSGFVAASTALDCDDTLAAVNPAAPEACGDGVDNDCDGKTDDQGIGGGSYYLDADQDGWPDDWILFGACEDLSVGLLREADAPTGSSVPDCNPNDPAVRPGAPDPWYDGVDSNCDGADDYDRDADGFRDPSGGGADCDDSDPTVYPDAPDAWYDGVDADCREDDDYDQDRDGFVAGPDCNDTNAAVFPGALDAWYDGVDSDCAGNDDYDRDGDGALDPRGGGDDCDDDDVNRHPGAADIWYDGVDSDCAADDDYDQDGDASRDPRGGGYDCDDTDGDRYPGAPDTPYDGVDADCAGDDDYDLDGDGFRDPIGGGSDCDDTDPQTHPGAPDVWYDGIDSDCANNDDYDQDGDGFADPSGGGLDCADTDPNVRPGAPDDWYDGVDADCAGNDDYDLDGDGYRDPSGGGADCADTDPNRHPGATETWYDGVDQDCDGGNDYDQDGDGRTDLGAPIGTADDCDDQNAAIFAGAAEVPEDGIDQDCNAVDAVSCYADADDDAYGSILVLGLDGSCATGFTPQGGDCDDTDPDTYPGAPELCDRVDQDCDGTAQGGVASAQRRDGTTEALSDGATVSALDVERIDMCGGTWDFQVQLDGSEDDVRFGGYPTFPRPRLASARPLVQGSAGRRAAVTLHRVDLAYDDNALTVMGFSSADPFARAQLTLDDVRVLGATVESLVDTTDVDVAIFDTQVEASTFERAALFLTGGTLVLDNSTFADNVVTHTPGDDDALVVGISVIADLSSTRLDRTEGRAAAFWDSVVQTTATTWEDNWYDPREAGSFIRADGGAMFLDDGLWDDEGSVFRRNATLGNGGAVYARDTDVTLQNSVFEANGVAPGWATANPVEVGGTLWVDGDLFAYDTSITDSTATLRSGAVHHTGGMLWLEGTDILDSTLLPGNTGPVALHSSGNWAVIREDSRIAGFVGEETTCIEVHHSDTAYLHGMEFTDCQALCLSLQNGISAYVTGNTFDGCQGDGGNGGALRVLDVGYLTIGRNTFVNNHADGHGGAVYAEVIDLEINNSNPVLLSWSPTGYALSPNDFTTERAFFDGNTAGGDGGALYTASRADLCDATFTNNQADGDGGAVYFGAALTMYDEYGCDQQTLIADNSADGRGGGLYVAGRMQLSRADLRRNSADAGGGAYVVGYVDGGVTASVTDNTAVTTGGGIHNDVSGNSDYPAGIPFTGNTAQRGGALYMSGYGFYEDFPPVLFANTPFTANVADEGSAIYIEPLGGLFEFGPYSFVLSDSFTGSIVLDDNVGPTAVVRSGPDGDWTLDVDAITPHSLDDQGSVCTLPLGPSQVTCAPGAPCICP